MTKGQTKLLPIRGYRGGRGSASSRCAPAIFRGSDARLGIKDPRCGKRCGVAERRWLWLASEGVVLVLRRSPLGCKLRAVVALRTVPAPGVCPVLRYSDEREGAFSGLVRSRFSEEQAEKRKRPRNDAGPLLIRLPG